MKVFTNCCFKWKLFPKLFFIFFIIVSANKSNAQGEWRMLGEIDSHTDDWGSTLVKDHSGNIYASLGTGMYRFNGTKWSELPGFSTGSYERKIAVDDAGDIYASATGEIPGEYFVSKYNGFGWTIILDHQSEIRALALDAAGNLYIATANLVYKWDGIAMTTILSMNNGEFVDYMACDGTSKLYVTGSYMNANGHTRVVNVWNGASWTELGSGSTVNDSFGPIVIDDQDHVYASASLGSNFNSAVFKWNGSSWTQLGADFLSMNISSYVYTLAVDAQHNVYAAGAFGDGSGKQTVLKWDGISWAKLGSGANAIHTASSIYQLIIDNDGNVCAALNNYDDISGTVDPESYIAKWNGTNWNDELGSSIAAAPHSHTGGSPGFGKGYGIITDHAGNLYRTASLPYPSNLDGPLNIPNPQQFYLAKWDGIAWSQATMPDSAGIDNIQIDGNGNFYATRGRVNANGKYYVGKWTGNAWMELGSGNSALNANNVVLATAIDGQNNVYAAGYFTNSNSKYYVAKWNGSAWTELGAGGSALNANNAITALAIRGANLYAIGYFTNASGQNYVAKWNGTSWSELGAGSTALNANAGINALATDQAGNVYAGGNFTNASGKRYVAKWNGISWSELGAVYDGFAGNPSSGIFQVLADSITGYIYVSCGLFTDQNQQDFLVARWDGVNWSGVAPGNFGYCMAVDTVGKLYVSPYREPRRYLQVAQYMAGPNTYTFTGNGNWNNFTNWENNRIPPANLPAGSKIMINPIAGGQCILNSVQTISPNAIFIVSAGAHFVVTGNLINNQ